MKNPKHNTDIERAVKSFLGENKIWHKQQSYIKGIAVVDFLLKNKKIIQCDGDYWHSLPGRKQRDNNQDFSLRFRGYKVLRLRGSDIKNHWRKCRNSILSFVKED